MISRELRLAVVGIVLGGCGLFGRDPGGDGDGDGGDGDCADVYDMLVGQWITPRGSTTSSSSYNLTTYIDGGGIDVHQYSGGYSNDVHYYDWTVSSVDGGDCNQILVDIDGTGWYPEYSLIHYLDAYMLDIEATDGTYYGTRTQYDRLGGGGGGDDESPTCAQPCNPDAPACTGDETCLNSEIGWVCLPSSCPSCWNSGFTCTYNSVSCAFLSCD